MVSGSEVYGSLGRCGWSWGVHGWGSGWGVGLGCARGVWRPMGLGCVNGEGGSGGGSGRGGCGWRRLNY